MKLVTLKNLAISISLGSAVVECLTRDQGAAGSSLTRVTALWSLSKTRYPNLVLIQPRKTHPCVTERLLIGHKESNQLKKIFSITLL